MSKISGPLLDRIDIPIDVPAVNYKGMRSGAEPESSAKIRERVTRARGSQLERFSSSPREKLYCNAQMGPRHIRAFCELSADCEKLLERAMAQQGLTARAHDRILKVEEQSPTWKEENRSSPSTSPRPSSTTPSIARSGLKTKKEEGRPRPSSFETQPGPTAAVTLSHLISVY
jgi:hypothetical protein